MDKISRPRGLIRFMSENQLAGATPSKQPQKRLRLAAYAGLFVIFGGLIVWTMTHRDLLLVNVIRDRGALLRETTDGHIENVYTLKLMNLDDNPHTFSVQAEGLPGIAIVGQDAFTLESGAISPETITVSVPDTVGLAGVQPIRFVVQTSESTRLSAKEKSSFVLPK
jgi:polyferredoxin